MSVQLLISGPRKTTYIEQTCKDSHIALIVNCVTFVVADEYQIGSRVLTQGFHEVAKADVVVRKRVVCAVAHKEEDAVTPEALQHIAFSLDENSPHYLREKDKIVRRLGD